MSDLISRDALFAEIQRYLDRYGRGDTASVFGLIEDVTDIVVAAPAVDAAPVVRCRDCKYWSGRYDKPGEVTAIGYCCHPSHHIMPLSAGWYCADGAKMDGGDTDEQAD